MKINSNSFSYNSEIKRNNNYKTEFKSISKMPEVYAVKYPNAENIRAIYLADIPFKGHNDCDNLLPPKFKNETLNAILSRNTDISGLSTKNAEYRKDSNEILASYFGEDGLKLMQLGRAYDVMYNMVTNGAYDGTNFEEADKFFMTGIQRLVDDGAIDDKTFVIIDTGHAIPMAAQLLKESNRESLGNVKGSFILGEISFPKGCPNAKTREDADTQELARSCSNYRISSQAITYGDNISSAYNKSKDNKDENGALFIGIDFHRQTRLDISKLPTADELKALGIKKVVVVQELPPVSSFSSTDAEKIYQPLTQEQALKSLRFMKRACIEAEKTPYGEAVNEESKSVIKEYLIKASDALKSELIEKTYAKLNKPDQKAVSKQIEKMKFGYNSKNTARGDISDYLQKLKKESKYNIGIILEGADLVKLRSYPLDKLIGVKDKLIARESESFEQTLNGDYITANGHLQQ